MATKKQKRSLGEARQKANREASIASGLKAQQQDIARRKKKHAEQEAEDKRAKAKKAMVLMKPEYEKDEIEELLDTVWDPIPVNA
jgi:hypothetical protein